MKVTDLIEDASPEQEYKFHKKLDKLVHDTFGMRPEEKKKKKKKDVDEGPEDDQFRSDVFNFLGKKLNQAEQELQNAQAATPEEQENKDFALKMFNFMKKKMQQQEQAQDSGI